MKSLPTLHCAHWVANSGMWLEILPWFLIKDDYMFTSIYPMWWIAPYETTIICTTIICNLYIQTKPVAFVYKVPDKTQHIHKRNSINICIESKQKKRWRDERFDMPVQRRQLQMHRAKVRRFRTRLYLRIDKVTTTKNIRRIVIIMFMIYASNFWAYLHVSCQNVLRSGVELRFGDAI